MRTFAQKPKATQQAAPAKSTLPNRARFGRSPRLNSTLPFQRTIENQAVPRMSQTNAQELEAVSSGKGSTRLAHDFSEIQVHPKSQASIQTKLTVSSPGDSYEQEADRVSDRVLRIPEPQRACSCAGGCSRCQTEQRPQANKHLQTKRAPASEAGQVAVPPIVHEAVASPGQALDSVTRGFMESRFGHDFGQVRIHADEKAAEAARSVNARAYTLGQNVVFGAGQFAPGTSAGKSLLAHELTHVLQQGDGRLALQRQPDEKPVEAANDFQLPWKHGDHSLFEEKSSGIRFLVATGNNQETAIRAAIPAIGKQVAADNARIKDPSSRVTICIIAITTTRFAHWNGKPVLALDPHDVNVETAAHEMGHAIFNALRIQSESKSKDAAKAGNFRLTVADIYARLSATKEFTEGNEAHPAGLWIADPSQWAPGSASEHPWQDPDEFFASAKAASQINRKGFESAIARFKKVDPKVEAPAKELLALLDAFFKKGELPSKGVPTARAATAKQELGRETGVSKVEDTIMSDTPLDWLLNPASRPKKQRARPSLETP
jgi:hypothetical protein